jgi:L-ascorbate metabolism protein UlaG (beta-lactamase superfamily)
MPPDRIINSPQFRNGSFHNTSPTPMLAENASYLTVIGKSLGRPSSVKPKIMLPSLKTDLISLHHIQQPVIVWFGHSSYLIYAGGKNILVDPVFSGYASPVSLFVRAFPGSDVFFPEDMPPIDLLIVTHNHYDHLDIRTIAALAPRIKKGVTPLGVAGLLSGCGIPDNAIVELDWWDAVDMDNIRLTATPARHFSGRGLNRGGSLWSSFVLGVEDYKIFVGGDSGYDKHFAEIGNKNGPFDIAILECGQYSVYWPFIHMMPEETVQAAIDLRAKRLMPVHWGKFALSTHPWTEPIERVTKEANRRDLHITTPMIGEPVIFDRTYPSSPWWRS